MCFSKGSCSTKSLSQTAPFSSHPVTRWCWKLQGAVRLHPSLFSSCTEVAPSWLFIQKTEPIWRNPFSIWWYLFIRWIFFSRHRKSEVLPALCKASAAQLSLLCDCLHVCLGVGDKKDFLTLEYTSTVLNYGCCKDWNTAVTYRRASREEEEEEEKEKQIALWISDFQHLLSLALLWQTDYLDICGVGIESFEQVFPSPKWHMLLLPLKKFGRLKSMKERRRKRKRGKGRGKSLGKIGNARYEHICPTLTFPSPSPYTTRIQVLSVGHTALHPFFCFHLIISICTPCKNCCLLPYNESK